MSIDLEMLLREALAPVEPPASMARELEATLSSWAGLAQGELEGWELQSMRDPRNWVRPAAAAAVSVTAGTALVVLRVRLRQRAALQESSNLREFAERTIHDIAEEARRVLPDR